MKKHLGLFACGVMAVLLSGCQAVAAPVAAWAGGTDEKATRMEFGQLAAAEAADMICADPAFLSTISVHGKNEQGYPFSTYATRFASIVSPSSWNVVASPTEIDDHAVAFVTGHGSPETVTLNGRLKPLPLVQGPLGNCTASNNGKLRYYILDACNVMAHGPPCADYTCPQDWHGDINKDNAGMRNVYARWGKHLGNNMRMICGPSTLIDPQNVEQVVASYTEGRGVTSLADSILSGLAHGAVAICLTLGGKDIKATPLVTDQDFTTTGNTGPETHYHIQYSKPFAEDYTAVTETMPVPVAAGERLAALLPTCMPAFIMGKESEYGGQFGTQATDFDLATSEQAYFDAHPLQSESFYVQQALNSLDDRGFLSREFQSATVQGLRMMLARTPVDGSEGQQVTQKNVVVTLRPQIDVSPYLQPESTQERTVEPATDLQLEKFLNETTGQIPFADPNARLEAWLNNDGSLIGVVQRYMPIGELELYAVEKVKTLDEAWDEAEAMVTADHSVSSWTVGYAPGPNSGMDGRAQMHIWYKFYFTPDDSDGTRSPLTVSIPGATGELCPMVNNPVNTSFIQGLNFRGGQMAGEFIAERLPDGGRVAVITSECCEVLRWRAEGAVDALRARGLDVVVVDDNNYIDFVQAQILVEGLLADDRYAFDATFATTDEMALGAYAAVWAAGGNQIIVGYDATPNALEAIKDGTLTASIRQGTSNLAYGGTIEVVTAENVDYFMQ